MEVMNETISALDHGGRKDESGRTIYTFLPIRSAEMMLQSIEFLVYIESMCSTLNYKNRGLSQKK